MCITIRLRYKKERTRLMQQDTLQKMSLNEFHWLSYFMVVNNANAPDPYLKDTEKRISSSGIALQCAAKTSYLVK